jgi:transcriptional regulator with XRE-family HTH domain
MHVGYNIKKIRELKNLNQEYIAKELGISTRAYSKIETGETQLTINRLFDISKIIDVNANEILGFDSNLIFNNNFKTEKGGKFFAYNNTEVAELQKLYERIIKEKDKIIELLEYKLKAEKTLKL